MELPSRRKIPAVNRNLSLNSCFVLLRVKSTYSLTVECIGLGGGALNPVVPIFVEHWGDNLQFYPKFALLGDEPRSRFCSGVEI